MSPKPSRSSGQPEKLRAVLDTNTLISGMITEKGSPAAVLRAWQNNAFVMVSCQSLIEEFVGVAHRSHLQVKYKLTDDRIEEMAQLIRAKAFLTSELYKVDVIKDDPDDNVAVSCALEGSAQYIVSGDSHLISLKEYQGIRMIVAGDFLGILREDEARKSIDHEQI